MLLRTAAAGTLLAAAALVPANAAPLGTFAPAIEKNAVEVQHPNWKWNNDGYRYRRNHYHQPGYYYAPQPYYAPAPSFYFGFGPRYRHW